MYSYVHVQGAAFIVCVNTSVYTYVCVYVYVHVCVRGGRWDSVT